MGDCAIFCTAFRMKDLHCECPQKLVLQKWVIDSLTHWPAHALIHPFVHTPEHRKRTVGPRWRPAWCRPSNSTYPGWPERERERERER